jgi:hypothetical protein
VLRNCFERVGVGSQRYKRRLEIVNFKIRCNLSDKPIWQWLKQLLDWLGTDGMSSEDTEVGIGRSYRVKVLVWRRHMEEYMDWIDGLRSDTAAPFASSGQRPSARVRYPTNPESTRPPPSGLPQVLYDYDWLQGLDEDYREVTLCVSKEKFDWLRFHVQKRKEHS